MRSGQDAGYGFFIPLDGAEAGSAGLASVRSPLCSRTQSDRKMMRNEGRRGCKAPFSGLRHTSGEHAAQHTMNAALLRQLGGVKVRLLWFGEEELCGSHSLKKMHEAMAARTLP